MKDRPHSTCELVYVDIDYQFVIVLMQAKKNWVENKFKAQPRSKKVKDLVFQIKGKK